MRYKIVFSYDGTFFCGYQKQPGQRSVEEELEKALFSINNHKKTSVTSSGRTDKGVHALKQTAHFDIYVEISLHKLKRALNSLLPEDIHVISTEIVDKGFHARYMVKKKTYRYIINMGEYDPLLRNYEYQYNRKLDVLKMKEAIKYFVGEHDFKNFVSNEAVKENYVRKIFNATIREKNEKVIIDFVGNGFMKYQVRNMVGTLIKIGQGTLEPSIINDIFSDVNGKIHILTAKSEGLYLIDVHY